MSTVRCSKCNSLVATRAKVCHICGAKMRRTSKLVWVLALVVAAVFLKVTFTGAPSSGPVAVAATPAAVPAVSASPAAQTPVVAPIRPDALDKYTKETHPKVFAKWGAAGAKRIEDHQRLAADKIALSTQCDAVSIVGLSEQRSSPPSNIVVFVDCDNGQRFYVGSKDVAGTPAPESARALGEEAAISICRDSIRTSAKYPSSVSFRALGTNAAINKTTGGTTVYMDFESKNDFGNLLPQRAVCVFPLNGKPELRVTGR